MPQAWSTWQHLVEEYCDPSADSSGPRRHAEAARSRTARRAAPASRDPELAPPTQGASTLCGLPSASPADPANYLRRDDGESVEDRDPAELPASVPDPARSSGDCRCASGRPTILRMNTSEHGRDEGRSEYPTGPHSSDCCAVLMGAAPREDVHALSECHHFNPSSSSSTDTASAPFSSSRASTTRSITTSAAGWCRTFVCS